MQGHYLTHFAAMLQIKLNVLPYIYNECEGQETCRSRLYPGVGGGGGLRIGCIFYLKVNLFITGGLWGGGELISGITGMFFFFASLLQYPEVLKLEEELAHVRSAAKVK